MQPLRTLSVLFISLIFLSGCAAGRTAFNKGEKFEMSGDLDQAVLKYAEASIANPEIGEYRLRFLKSCAEAAQMHLGKGDNFSAVQKYDDALREYQTAYALDPSLEKAKQRADKTTRIINALVFYAEGEEFEKNNKIREAYRSYVKAAEMDPANAKAKESAKRLVKSVKPRVENFELNLKSTKPITLKFKDAKLKEVFNILTKLSGINFIFDDAVKDVNFSIYLENGTFYQAMDVITELNKLDKKVLNESNVIIYPKTPDKKKQYEELYLQTYYLNKIDGKKAINLLRTMMQIKKIYVNEEMNAIVIRDTPDVIALAGKILEANDIPDPEVVLEVEVVELSKKNAENLGFVLSRYAISAQGFNNGTGFSDTLNTASLPSGNNIINPVNPSNLLQLFQYNQFSSFITVPSATFNFGKTLANGETLSNPKMRIKNKEKAKFNVGTRVPITTTSSPTGGGVSVNVQYVDVGVKMNAEPTIQLNNDISIKLSLEVSSILSRDTVGGIGSATTVVTIGTRNLDTVLSLKDGETSIIGGLIQDTKSKSKQKISLLGDIPIIGSIFSSHDDSNDKTELVLAITPRIVRSLAVPDQNVAAFWSGKEDEPSTEKNYTSFAKEEEPSFPSAATAATATPAAPAPALAPAPSVAAPASAPSVAAPAPAPKSESRQKPKAPVPTDPSTAGSPVKPEATAKSDKLAVLKVAAPKQVKVDTEFQVEINIADVTNMYNSIFAVQFDPNFMEYVGAKEGDFLKKDGKPTSFNARRADVKGKGDQGKVSITSGRVGSSGGVTGSGTLAVLTFKAKAKGTAPVGLSEVYILPQGGSKLMNADIFNAATEIQ